MSGNGFPATARVFVDDQPQPGVTVVNTDTVTFSLAFPAHPQPSRIANVSLVLADGTPSNAVPLGLQGGDVVVLGDSIAWGQGLLEPQKWSSVVFQKWQTMLGAAAEMTMLAHSGAVIGVGDATPFGPLDGEVPTSYPTILQQVGDYRGPTERVGLVLVNGGINDCNVRIILSPTATDDELTGLAAHRCGTDMGLLLDAVVAQFPLALICVVGYYPLVSKETFTRLTGPVVQASLLSLGLPAAVLGALTSLELEAIGDRCAVWAAEANRQLADAAAARTSAQRTVVFADPGFSAQNAVGASRTLLFGLNNDLSLQDPVAGARQGVCHLAGGRTDELECDNASIGHPTASGASQIASAVISALAL